MICRYIIKKLHICTQTMCRSSHNTHFFYNITKCVHICVQMPCLSYIEHFRCEVATVEAFAPHAHLNNTSRLVRRPSLHFMCAYFLFYVLDISLTKVCMYVFVCMHVRMHVSMCMHVCIYACMYVCMHAFMYVCMHLTRS